MFNILRIARDSEHGLFLEAADGEDVLLPNKYSPEEFEVGEEIEVFVYLDNDERKIATTEDPKIFMHEFAYLEVKDVNAIGAFLDWGMEKELFVPFAEQREKMEVDKSYIVYLDVDRKSNRLYGSSKIEKRIENKEILLEAAEEVEILIYKKTDLGYSVIVNNSYKGLVFFSDVYQELQIGELLRAYVKNIHSDNKIDISLQAIGYENNKDSNSLYILDKLHQAGGSLAFGDKSSPDEIYSAFQMSKKAFKRAIGDLYKQRRIVLSPNEIKINAQTGDENR